MPTRFEAGSGKKQWTRQLYSDYNANDGYFGAGQYTPSPSETGFCSM